VIPDYDTAPAVRFPVAGQQAYDAFRWVHENGAVMGWDGDRVSAGGAGAGGKLALNAALQAIDDGYGRPDMPEDAGSAGCRDHPDRLVLLLVCCCCWWWWFGRAGAGLCFGEAFDGV
jgi:hypothetical protein